MCIRDSYSSLRIVQFGFKVILKMTSVEVTVLGEENIPDEPVLFVGNHRSFFDILLTYSRCKRLTGYVADVYKRQTSAWIDAILLPGP